MWKALTSGSMTVTAMAVAVLAGTIVLSLLRRLREAQRANASETGPSFHTVAQAVPAILWTAQADGSVDFVSDKLHAFSGFTREQTLGWGWSAVLHPDDVAACVDHWKHCVATGEAYELESRIRRSDGIYCWFLVRAYPVCDDHGHITKWIGSCTDIEHQKHNQQKLEEEIKARTEELAETNTRLQKEMMERDLARKELDQQNERMMQQLTERSRRATMLAKMGEHLQSCMTRDEVFAAALGFAPRIFPVTRGAVALLNSGRSLVEVLGSWAECKIPAPVFEPNFCWALRTGHPHLVVSGDTTAPCAHAAGVTDSYLCIPILAQGETLGILHVQATPEAPALGDAEISLKTTFAAQVGLSITNIRLREALRTQSIKDPLTGLHNRRYLEEMMERETRRAVRAEHGLGMLILDLDHFKKFNDTYGHDAGDTVLRETAVLLAKSVRAEDIVCRFGGEEFVIILPMADLKASQARGERIRSKIRELTVLHQGQSLGMITVSVGVAALPLHGTLPAELLAAADAALYRAKREGRDRVVSADLPAEREAEAEVKTAEVGKP
jgi:diguanylate cyclase (GGDEF)-like protein/PAS domain S-box-containing protein